MRKRSQQHSNIRNIKYKYKRLQNVKKKKKKKETDHRNDFLCDRIALKRFSTSIDGLRTPEKERETWVSIKSYTQ